MKREELEVKLYEEIEDMLTPEETESLVNRIMRLIPKNSLEQVREFHEIMELSHAKERCKPQFPDETTSQLRFNLIFEELMELACAMGIADYAIDECKKVSNNAGKREWKDDLSVKGTLDALLDLRYVVDGTVVSCQMEEIHDAAFEEVHRSNMSKLHPDMTHGELYENVQFFPVEYQGKTMYICKRDDGKVIKYGGYSPANLDQFLNP